LYPLPRLWGLRSTMASRIVLGVMSASYFWCLLGVIFPVAIGPHYTGLRYGIIDGNLYGGVLLLCALVVLHAKKGLAAVVGFWVVFAWLYIRTVSSVA
jgi:hypothetical protein